MKQTTQLCKIMAAAGVLIFQGCVKIPADVDFISPAANYNQTLFEPVLGRTTLLPTDPTVNIFNPDNSTTPLTFKLMNMRDVSGTAVDIFNKTFPVQVWKEAYTGQETTREEVEKKRTIEQHHLFEVREHSGQFVMWAPTDLQYLNAIKVQPDSGYRFDVEVSNTGGSKMIRNLQLKPMRAQPYEPNSIDPVTGNSYGALTPYIVSNIKNFNDQTFLGAFDVIMAFSKDPTSAGNSLSFEFRDSSYNPIDPRKFNETKWEEVVHHFGTAKFTAQAVTYDVAYPIPLALRQTRYTDGLGERAVAAFKYGRVANGASRVTATIETHFAIHEPGNWKIVFWFWRGNPDFRDN